MRLKAISARSRLCSGFGVVSSLSPTKIEFAPAMKQSVMASRLSDRRPALSRTRDEGISVLAAAIAVVAQHHFAPPEHVEREGEDAIPQEFQMRQQQPVTVQGSMDDDSVKDALINIVRGGDRYCPDVRLDAVDLLRARNDDPDVRSALCHAVHNDKNAAVRLCSLYFSLGSVMFIRSRLWGSNPSVAS